MKDVRQLLAHRAVSAIAHEAYGKRDKPKQVMCIYPIIVLLTHTTASRVVTTKALSQLPAVLLCKSDSLVLQVEVHQEVFEQHGTQQGPFVAI